MRGLNETDGRNRLRFQKLKSRVKHERRRVDVVHKVCVALPQPPLPPSLPPSLLGYPPHPAHSGCVLTAWVLGLYLDGVACTAWHVVWVRGLGSLYHYPACPLPPGPCLSMSSLTIGKQKLQNMPNSYLYTRPSLTSPHHPLPILNKHTDQKPGLHLRRQRRGRPQEKSQGPRQGHLPRYRPQIRLPLPRSRPSLPRA